MIQSSVFPVVLLRGLTGVCCVFPVEPPGGGKSRLTVADLYGPEFHIHDPEATWISGEYRMFAARTVVSDHYGCPRVPRFGIFSFYKVNI